MIKLAQVDSIPAVYTEGGPPLAGLVFRVGSGDELLSQRGITHLIEHLALHRLGTTDYHFNGTTAPSFTSFFTRGDQPTAVAFLQQVVAGLNNLPIDRLETEKGVLRTEADGRSTGIIGRLHLWRYGAVGLGAAMYAELGLSGLRPYDLTRWVSRYFTRENAVLWFSGMEPPAGLRLDLPSGRREPILESVSMLPTTPAFHSELPQHLGLHGIVRRSTAATVFSAVWQRELFRRMRQENGYCYTAAADYSVIDARQAAIVAVADIAPELRAAALGEFVDTLAAMQWGELSPSVLDEVKTTIRSAWAEPGAEASRLPGAAMDLLMGRPITQLEGLRAELDAVTIADVRAVAAEVAPSALLLTPAGLAADWAGFARVPATSEQAVTGRPFVPINDPSYSLVIGVDGVSMVTEEGPLTVLYNDCQAMLVRPDGARTLIGRDGVACPIEPTLFTLPEGMMATIDQHVPPERVVRLPARSPEQIPLPPPGVAGLAGQTDESRHPGMDQGAYEGASESQQRGAPASHGLSTGGRVAVILGIIVLSLVTLVMAFFAIAMMMPVPDSDPVVNQVMTVFFWVLAALGALGILGLSLLLRRR